ncbi:MAG: SDR family oxidoreductase, partial [Fidelibacterota bacterium]
MFTGKTILVTGGCKGIGKAIADRFHSLGGNLFILDIDADSGQDEIRRHYLKGDVRQSSDVEMFVRKAAEETGVIDVLVNNAGIIRDGAIWNLTEDDFDLVLDVNLKGAWLTCRAAAPLMREQRSGRIINIGSRAWLGNFGQSNYSASKGGLVSLTRVLALELASRNITVNTVAPGLIETELTRSLPKEVYQQLLNKQPGKQAGKPEDVAAAVTFLASPEARFITG